MEQGFTQDANRALSIGAVVRNTSASDERGRDLGGEGQRFPEATCAPGNRETWVVPLGGGPAAAEDGRTEVYPYCDPSTG